MKMYVISLLLLVSPISCSPAVPFYCRRFKGNCSVRRESICCREESIAATAAKEPVEVEEPVEIKITGDNLLASSSIIEEVVVAPDDPPLRNNLLRVSTTTAKPGRPVPRFCKLLKFDCKKRSNPLCCKDSSQELGQEKLGLKEQQIKEEPKVEPKINVKLPPKNVTSVNDDDKTVKGSSDVFLGRKPFKTSKPQNKFSSARNSAIFSKRPSLNSSGKSPLCKIINCEKARNKRHKCCEEEVKEQLEKVTKSVDEEKTEFNIQNEDITVKDNDKIVLENPLDIEQMQNISTERDDYFSTTISTATEDKSAGVQFQLNSEDVDNITVSKDQHILHEEDLQNTEVYDISSATAVTETIEIETSTDQQKVKELKGIKIENETSLLDSIMNQLSSFNISSLETSEEEDTGIYTDIFSTEKTLLETMDSINDDVYVTLSDENTDLEDNTTTFKPEVATAINMLKEGVGENHTGITIVAELSDLTVETFTFTEIPDGKLNMETTTQAEHINLTSFSINNDSTEDPLLSAGKNNPSLLPIIEVSESQQVNEIGDKNTSYPMFDEINGLFEFVSENKEKTVKDDSYSIDNGFDLLEAYSTNSIYVVDTKGQNKESSFVGNLIAVSPDKDDPDAYSPAPYTVISLPGYSNLRQPFVLQYPGMVTATITRVSKSYSWL